MQKRPLMSGRFLEQAAWASLAACSLPVYKQKAGITP